MFELVVVSFLIPILAAGFYISIGEKSVRCLSSCSASACIVVSAKIILLMALNVIETKKESLLFVYGLLFIALICDCLCMQMRNQVK